MISNIVKINDMFKDLEINFPEKSNRKTLFLRLGGIIFESLSFEKKIVINPSVRFILAITFQSIYFVTSFIFF